MNRERYRFPSAPMRQTDVRSQHTVRESGEGLLTEELLRGLPAWNDCLQENRVLVLDERHQVHIVLALNDENALACVTLRIRVLQNVEQVPTFDVEDDVLEPDAAVRLELRVLGIVPDEVLHQY